MVQVLIGVLLAGFVATVGFGLATGRIAWRQQGCCPADPARDLRMRDTAGPPNSAAPHHPTPDPQ